MSDTSAEGQPLSPEQQEVYDGVVLLAGVLNRTMGKIKQYEQARSGTAVQHRVDRARALLDDVICGCGTQVYEVCDRVQNILDGDLEEGATPATPS